MSARRRLFVMLSIVGIPLTGWSCEPILPLVQLLSGASLAGPALITKSLVWLTAAVAVKCFAFVFLERRLPWRKAVLFMLLANVLSTIPGLLIAAFAGSIGGIVLAVPLVYILGMLVERRLKLLAKPEQRTRIAGGVAAFAFTAFFVVSIVLFELAGGALEGRSYGSYWILKFLFVTMVACTGIVISAVLEEYAIARFTRNTFTNQSFYPSVFRANYITLAAVLFIAAMQMLPKRLHAPHFIVSWLHSLPAMLCPTSATW